MTSKRLSHLLDRRSASWRRNALVISCALAAGCEAAEAPRDEPGSALTQPSADAGAQPGMPSRLTSCKGRPLPPRKEGPFAVGPASAGLPDYWPTTAWKSLPPAELGFDAAKLAAAVDFKTAYSRNQAVLVIRHGYVAAAKYYAPFAPTQTHESYSMAKSFSSGLVGIAIGEGKLASTDEKICKFYPEQWSCDDSSDPRSRITVQHAMNLTTGLQWREDWRSTQLTKPNDAFAGDTLNKTLSRKSVQEPGTGMRYSTGDPSLLTEVIRKSTGLSPYEYGKQKVFDVIGAEGIRWNQDAQGRTTTFMGVQATAEDYARFAYLYLRGGQWEGKQVVPADWVARTTRAEDACEDWNKNLWHINLPVRLGPQDPACPSLFCQPTEYAQLPADGYFAEGVYGQFMFIVPSEDLVVVRLANDAMGSERWDDYARGFLTAVLGAIVK